MSIWNKNKKRRKYQKLNEDLSVDILIIGGGLTGLNTAYYLQDKDICIVEANEIGFGVTLNSTAKINYLQEGIYNQIINDSNELNASIYLKSQKDAIKYLKEIIEKENIDCDFEQVPSYLFANSKEEINILEKEVSFLKKNGIDIKENELPISNRSYKSYYVMDTYIFNPYKYLLGLSKILKNKINIYEKTRIFNIVKEDDYYYCYTKDNVIKAKKVILACHYPFFLFPMIMPIRCSIEKSYIIVSKVKEDGNFTCINVDYPIYSCRFYNDGKNIYQLSVSKSNSLANLQDDKYYFKRVKEIFGLKEEDIIMQYTNTDILTPDHMPYIGKIKENMYIGVGYNTWGMTNSVLAANLIANEILYQKNEYKKVFNPNRFPLANIMKLPKYFYDNAKTFIGTKINKNKSWYSNRVSFIKKNGESLAIYVDEFNNSHIVYNKCPHLGCSLIFNEVEKTWDCPCHSSRYDIDGYRIKGPSNYDITYKSKENMEFNSEIKDNNQENNETK